MDFGNLKYHVTVRAMVKDYNVKPLMLTLIDVDDEDILTSQGISELRKKRIIRLTHEAYKQGMPLGYEDLNALLLSSISTLKRDVNILERHGYSIPLKGRRKG
ncbi:MAG: DUF1670 domain-containing protein [Nitrospirae bacterium]|nr:DUF1670 domain-containing protein [Nitrospirota bacterium]